MNSRTSNKFSPSPLKENIQRYHNEKIRERSRDLSCENQVSPPLNTTKPCSMNK